MDLSFFLVVGALNDRQAGQHRNRREFKVPISYGFPSGKENNVTSVPNASPGAVAAGRARPAARGRFSEAKNGFKTSEFYAMLALVIAVLVATYVNDNDSLGHQEGWLYASIIAAAYIISRGLAKLGVREPAEKD